MQLTSDSFNDGEQIPGRLAFGVPDEESHVALSSNRNPHLEWQGAPESTESFVVLCIDPDVPTKPDDVNQEGREVPSDLPRADFVHWVLVDVPSSRACIEEGEYCDAIVNGGKDSTSGEGREGINDYTSWFAGDPDMGGTYVGYDGPCPPWNDSLMHHYTFSVYALSTSRLDVDGEFTAEQVKEAMQGHILAEASITGLYSLNPRLLD